MPSIQRTKDASYYRTTAVRPMLFEFMICIISLSFVPDVFLEANPSLNDVIHQK